MQLDIDTATIRRLRDALLSQAEDPDAGAGAANPVRHEALVARIAPFIETMYLVALADGHHSPEEMASVHGAIRLLSSGVLEAAALDQLITNCDAAIEQYGVEGVLQGLGNRLCANRADRETAFTLAAATALADAKVDDAETGLLRDIAEWFGVSSRRANELLGPIVG